VYRLVLTIFYLYLFKYLASLLARLMMRMKNVMSWLQLPTESWKPSWYHVGRAPTHESPITACRFSQLDDVMNGKIERLVC